jgi:hypothetical protein
VLFLLSPFAAAKTTAEMRITIKTLQQKTFPLDVEMNEKVCLVSLLNFLFKIFSFFGLCSCLFELSVWFIALLCLCSCLFELSICFIALLPVYLKYLFVLLHLFLSI